MKSRLLKTFMVAFAILLFCSIATFAQNSENIVILWDVTGSLLPQEVGMKDLDGSRVPTYSEGNGLWLELKKAVIECIQYAEEDPSNNITIVPFNDNVLGAVSNNATSTGKAELVNYVKTFHYKSHKHTNIVDPIRNFYSLLDGEKINYMFLFTDGDNDQPATKPLLIPTLDSWTKTTQGQNAYGFYVLAHPDADKPDIRKSVESQDNIWMVKDAKVRIKICSFPTQIKYNVRDDKGAKTVSIRGKYADATGDVQLISNDEYYDIICSDFAISNGKIGLEVRPKAGVTPPESHIVSLTPQLSGTDPYTFVGPKEILLEVSNLPERSLSLNIEDKDFGKASYHGAFLISKEENKPAEMDIMVDFSDQAKLENSSALMKVYLIDGKKGEKEVSPASQNITIKISGNELKGDSFKLTPDMSDIKLSVIGQPDTKSGTYYGRLELIPTNLDNYAINGSTDAFKWSISFSQRMNPLKLGLIWLVILLAAAFLLWMIVLKPIFYPRFGSIQKTFIIPGMAPLVIKFKGARMVVVAASHPKKQSGWNRFWTGKIIYKTHPTFEDPITFKPIRGRRVLARAPLGTYQILPNPIPGVGEATIFDVRKNLRINIH